jgi:uncharacterized protein (DUF1800 family)
MGEPLYAKELPTGYKDTADAWLSTANVIARINFAGALVNGDIHGIKVDAAKLPKEPVARGLLDRNPTPQTIAAIVISAPEFQRR